MFGSLKRKHKCILLIIISVLLLIVLFWVGYLDRNKASEAEVSYFSVDGSSCDDYSLIQEDSLSLYISNDFNEYSDGSKEHPFTSITDCQEYIRSLNLDEFSAVCVKFLDGEYLIDSELVFSSDDSGSDDCMITYMPDDDAEVTFIGSCSVPDVDIEKIATVTNTEGDNVCIYKADLSAYKAEIGNIIQNYGFGVNSDGTYNPTRFYVNNEPLQLSRYPDNGFLTIDSVQTDGNKTVISYSSEESNEADWNECQDILICGFWQETWAYNCQVVNKIDTENMQVELEDVTPYSAQEGLQFYLCNIVDEINESGEYCYQDGFLYFGWYSDAESLDLRITYNQDTFISLNGCSNICFQNIQFKYFRTTPIVVEGCQDIVIDNCQIYSTEAKGIILENSIDILVKDCDISNCGAGGIRINCGDRNELEYSNIRITGTKIHDVDQIYLSYSPAISISGVGIVVDNCELYNSNHSVIQLSAANDVLIYNNSIHDAVQMAADMGAIYYGRDPSILGVCIIGNQFYNIGNSLYESEEQYSIFIDDGSYGALIYGNTFRNTLSSANGNRYAIHNHGSRYSFVSNNTFCDYDAAMTGSSWGYMWWLGVLNTGDKSVYDIKPKIMTVDFHSDCWKEHYDNFEWKLDEQGLSISTDMWNKLYKQFPAFVMEIDLSQVPKNIQKILSKSFVTESSANIFTDNILVNTAAELTTDDLGICENNSFVSK